MLESIFGKDMAKPKGYPAGEVVSIFTEGRKRKVKLRLTKYHTYTKEIEKTFLFEDIERFYKSSTPFTRWIKRHTKWLNRITRNAA